MKINIYDKSLNRIAIIGNSFISCLWSEGYNTVEPFTLELNDTAENRKKVKLDYYIGRSDRKTLMVIKSIVFQDGKIVLSGKQAQYVLDDIAFIGTIKKNKKIDVIIPEKYSASQKYPMVEFATTDLGVKYPNQISHKSFLGLCETMCQETDTGFKSEIVDGEIVVSFYKPADKENLVFSTSFGNLLSHSLTLSNLGAKNYAIVLGAGEGDARKKVYVDLRDDKENGQRRDLIIDASDLQPEEGETDADYEERLYSRGVERLLECKETGKCDFSVDERDFGKRFDIGDKLIVNLKEYGIKLVARVVKFSQKAQNNKVDTTISVGQITFKRWL